MVQETEIDTLMSLLPFYANGTLDRANTARVKAAMAHSIELREELDTLTELARVVKREGAKMTEAKENTDDRLEAVLGRLEDNHPQATMNPNTAARQTKQPSQILAFLSPRFWHPAVSLSLLLAAGTMSAALVGLNHGNQQRMAEIATLQKKIGDLEFQLASGPGGAVNKADIMVQLKEDARWSDISALLIAENLMIISGPSDNTLSLSSNKEGAEVDALIERLRASPLVANVDKAA
jgi:hypothetical protein